MVHQRDIVVSLCCFYAYLTIGSYTNGVSLPPPITFPSEDQYVPSNSGADVTFNCTSPGDGTSAIWAINQSQIRSDDQFRSFQSRGVSIRPNTTTSSSSSVTVSSEARHDHGLTQVQCLTIQDVSTSAGQAFSIIIFDAPVAPASCTLQPTLMLVWTRPSNVPLQVSINYTIEINATEEGGMNFRNFTSDTFFSVQFLEDMLPDSESDCVEFEFFVSATNGAGTGPLARVQDTVPISPDVTIVSRELRVESVDLQSLTVQIIFPPVMPCSVTFSLTNYTVNINGAVNRILYPGDVILGEPLTISNLVQDVSSSLTITACNNVTCRTSDPRTLNTTDVQAVQAVFFENRLFLSCSFAANSQAQGCVFEFTINNTDGTDRYNVTREDGSMCTSAPYRLDAYGSVFVMDWEENGVDGNVTLNITNIVLNVSTLTEYTELTRCVEDDGTGDGMNITSVVIAVPVTVVILMIVAFFILVLAVVWLGKKRVVKLKLDKADMDNDQCVTYEFKLEGNQVTKFSKLLPSASSNRGHVDEEGEGKHRPPYRRCQSCDDEIEVHSSLNDSPEDQVMCELELDTKMVRLKFHHREYKRSYSAPALEGSAGESCILKISEELQKLMEEGSASESGGLPHSEKATPAENNEMPFKITVV